MNLNFGVNLKNLRCGRGVTQEALADSLGLSGQAKSRHETNVAYPDIELPVIAGLFVVTIDSILAVSADRSGVHIGEYLSRFLAATVAEARFEILNRWSTEFPDDWMAVYNANCRRRASRGKAWI